jgi:O-antigen/teichoic acid export membrane protein
MSLKLLGKNAVIYAIGNIGARAAVFLLIPLYTYSLSVADFGLLATLQVTIRIISVVIGGGMSTTLLRFTKEYEQEHRLNSLLGTSILVVLANGVAVAAVVFALLPWLFRRILHTQDVYSSIALACCAALAEAMSTHVMSYYRARHQAVQFMVTGISTAVLLFVVTFVLVRQLRLGVTGAMAALVLAHTSIFLAVLLCIVPTTGLRLSWSLAPGLVRFGFPLIWSQCSEMVIASAGVYFLSYFAGLEAVAVYSLGYKLSLILVITTISPFSLAFEPYVYSTMDRSGQRDHIARSFTYMVLCAVFMSSGLLLLTRLLLPKIAPPEYSSAFLVVLLLIPGTIFMGVFYFGQALLKAAQRTRTIAMVSTATAGVSFVLSYLLTAGFDWRGAALAFDISFILLGSVVTAIGVKDFSVGLERKRICLLACLLLSILLALFALRRLPVLPFAVLSVSAVVAGILLLLFYGFFHENEKLLFRQLAARLC